MKQYPEAYIEYLLIFMRSEIILNAMRLWKNIGRNIQGMSAAERMSR